MASKEYYQAHKEERKAYRKAYYQTHKEKEITYGIEYKENHKKEMKEWKRNYSKNYQRERRRNDINFKILCGLRERLNKAIKHNQKSGSAVKDLGCSVFELKIHLESKFQEGMTWENYGYRGWHIDHITPLISFNLQNREEFLKACHYSNLQPMWAEENLKKSDSLPPLSINNLRGD
jgi:hypothetical protein